MKVIKAAAFVIFFTKIILSQTTTIEINPLYLAQGFSIPSLSSFGTSDITNDVWNIGLLNPASLSRYNNFMAGLTYQYETKIDDAIGSGIGHERYEYEVPQSFGMILPAIGFNFVVSFQQLYNSHLDFGKIPITNIENPDGTGEYYEPDFRTRLYSFSLGVSYMFNNIFDENSFAVGARVSKNNLSYEEKLFDNSLKATSSDISWATGIVYELALNTCKFIRTGLFYENNVSINMLADYEDTNYGIRPVDTLSLNIVPYSARIKAQKPSKLKLDIETNYLDDFLFQLGAGIVFWNDVNSNINNQLELSGSSVYGLSDDLNVSLGFFYTVKTFKDDQSDFLDKFTAVFITAGLNYALHPLKIGLAIADSHLLSDEWRKQTIAKIGIDVEIL
jgi:hypothetical protein